MAIDLLPPNATSLERALAETSSAISEIPVPIDTMKDPARIPEHLLPYLARELSVDIWRDDWPIERKRWIVANSIRLHRLKGTLAGIKEHIELAGGEVVGTRLPPDGSYPVEGADRAAWLARFPQLRTYLIRNRAPDLGGFVAGDAYPDSEHISTVPLNDLGDEYAGRQAYLYEPRTGEETKLSTARRTTTTITGETKTVELVVLPVNYDAALVLDATAPTDGVVPFGESIAERSMHRYIDGTYTVRVEGQTQRNTISPGLTPVDIHPDMVREKRPLPAAAMIPGLTAFGEGENHLSEPDIELSLYERIYLFDPERVSKEVIVGGEFMTLDFSRLGRPAFTAELIVRTSQPRRREFCLGISALDADDALVDPPDMVTPLVEAVKASAAARDKVLIRTQTYRPITVASGRQVGTFRLGDVEEYRF